MLFLSRPVDRDDAGQTIRCPFSFSHYPITPIVDQESQGGD